jgi:hypothetical protein
MRASPSETIDHLPQPGPRYRLDILDFRNLQAPHRAIQMFSSHGGSAVGLARAPSVARLSKQSRGRRIAYLVSVEVVDCPRMTRWSRASERTAGQDTEAVTVDHHAARLTKVSCCAFLSVVRYRGTEVAGS